MIDIDVVKAKLAEVNALKFIGEAADFQAAAENNPTITPAAYVIEMGETPEPNKLGDIIIQKVSTSVGIVLVVKNLTDAKGVAAGADMRILKREVKDKLYGFVPGEGCAPFERGNGHLLAFQKGHMWWQDLYLTSYYDRSEQ